MSSNYHLPNELWIEIFELATARKEYSRFQRSSPDAGPSCIHTRSTLVQVCKLWRQLTTEILYREVSFAKGHSGLKDALEQEGFGKLVRRVELPYQCTATSSCKSSPLATVQLLRLCDHLETLVRPNVNAYFGGDHAFQFDADCCSLPTLKQLEWWQNGEAERTGGINSLGDVLRNAPNLQFLFVGNTATVYSSMDPRPVCLPHLHTLQLHSITVMLMYQLCQRWQLPALSHIVVDLPQPGQGLNCLWDRYGTQLESVEFGRSLRFFMIDVIRPCLQGCPNLKELNYYILFTYAPLPKDIPPCPSVTSLGLSFSRSEIFDDENQMWDLIEAHFDLVLSTEVFPNIKKVRLYGDYHVGDWESMLSHTRFEQIEGALRERGVEIET